MDFLSQIFNQDGLLQNNFTAYEYREGQLEMAQGVLNALIDGESLAVQAGTGLGKTFAYLVPALFWAVENENKVVVSTATLQLQSQLVKKDLPFLSELLKAQMKFNYALVKGRNNYICMRKLVAFARSGAQTPLFREVSDAPVWEKLRDLFYSEKLNDGDKDEIPFRVPDSLWAEVGSEAELCMRGRCPFYNECYFYKARQNQKTAHLLITNHALFFADLAVRRENQYNEELESVLADYGAVIFDEAQNTEDYATDHFSRDFSYGRVFYYAISVRNALRPQGILQWSEEQDFVRVDGRLESLLKRSAEFLIELADLYPDRSTRLLQKLNMPEGISSELLILLEELDALAGVAQTDEQKSAIQGYVQRGNVILADLTHCLTMTQTENYAYWVENSRGNDLFGIRLASAPVSLAEVLEEGLFSRLPVVMTSATLAGELLTRIGMKKPILLRFDSPFNYQKQARLYIPLNGPEPIASKSREFDLFTAEQVLLLTGLSQGRAFVLFTSYKSMDAVYDLCSEDLKVAGLTVLRQGEYRREEIIKRFRESGNGVLFAVSSFWEGVDIQGDDLSLVILVKLPFAVPTEPVLQARMEALQRQGQDPFNNFSLPMASLRLKQGFGRLIRSKTDRGVIAILDKRIKTKYYGHRFLKDLPPAPIIEKPEQVADFLAGNGNIEGEPINEPRHRGKNKSPEEKSTTKTKRKRKIVSSFDIDEREI